MTMHDRPAEARMMAAIRPRAAAGAPAAPAASPGDRPISPLTRLHIELRKLVDTRAGATLVAVTVLTAVADVLLRVLAEGPGTTAVDVASSGAGSSTYLLPILGIVATAGEWRDGTAPTTYTLDPRRSAVLAAKAGALLVVTALVTVLIGVSTLTASAVGGTPAGDPVAFATGLGDVGLTLAVYALLGIALGAALRDAALAFVVLLLGPLLVPHALGLMRATAPLVPYIDLTGHTLHRQTGSAPEQPLAAAVALLLWVVLPLAVGFVRNARSDVS